MQVLVHPRHWKDLSQEELGSSTSCIEYNWRMISAQKQLILWGIGNHYSLPTQNDQQALKRSSKIKWEAGGIRLNIDARAQEPKKKYLHLSFKLFENSLFEAKNTLNLQWVF
jgi:hypothetical protein